VWLYQIKGDKGLITLIVKSLWFNLCFFLCWDSERIFVFYFYSNTCTATVPCKVNCAE